MSVQTRDYLKSRFEHLDTPSAADFARLIGYCGARKPRDAWSEELDAMQRLLGTDGG